MDDDNVVSLSKTRAKRLMNYQKARSHHGAIRAPLLEQELKRTKIALANACAALEALVRRYGAQVFEREALERECGAGRIAWDVNDSRITLRLAPDKPDSA